MCWDRLIELDAESPPARHLVPRDAVPVPFPDPALPAPDVLDELAVVA
jgi:hypothetical protein